MFWLRSILFSSPLALVFGACWLFDRVSELQLSHDTGALVYAIQEPVGYLNPLVPSIGVTGEVTDLIFEPLLTRDDDLNLQPNLLDRWASQTVVTIRCSSEEAAGESEAMLRSGEYLGKGMKVLALDRTDSVITIALEGLEAGLDKRLVSEFAPENLGDYLLVKVTLKNSIHDSIESFLKGSVEKTQLRMLEFAGDREANLFISGETDLFLRELSLYYESNLSLDPRIEVMGDQCHTTSREMFLDLRTDVRWHDGRPFTASDVLFSFNGLTRPDSPLPLAASFWFVEKLTAVSTHRLKVECSDVPAMMLESWEKLPVLPAHLLRGLSDPKERDAFFATPVGTGPYRLSARRDDGGVELVANEYHFRAIPLEKRIGYRRFGSFEATLLALRSRTLDAIIPDERFTDWSERNPGSVRPIRCEPRIQHFVAWNLDVAPFDRNPVRLALAKAVDLKEVIHDTATGFEQPVTSLFYPGSSHHKEVMLLPLYDPRGAENLLEEEGYKLDEKTGLRKNANGQPLSFTLSVNEANAEHRRFAGALVEQWAGVGVSVKVEFLAWNDILSKRLAPRKFDALVLSWEIPFERDRYTVWHSSGVGPGKSNFSGLRSQVVDDILEKLRYEDDPLRLAGYTSALQKAIADLQPCFFVCDTGRIITVRSDDIEVYRPLPGGAGVAQPLVIGKPGLEQVRPWWVRRETFEGLEAGNLRAE